jgi:glycosyltransferase involved in cell wall biosynthesis
MMKRLCDSSDLVLAQRQSVPISARYAIITPAKNESAHIRKTIQSVISQTTKPAKWVIVDDGSSDQTAEIVASYLPSWTFMRLVTMPPSRGRDFSRKAAAFSAGLLLLQDEDCSFVGNLDADITLPVDYYARVLAEFEKDPRLGIAGGMVYSKTGRRFTTRDKTPDSVGGCVQLFRVECFREVGGYLPVPQGGIDAIAEIMARTHGWAVRKVPGVNVYEHRRTGTAQNGAVAAFYKEGARFHSLGYGTAFYFFRCIYHLKDRPYVLGSMLSWIGFLCARIRNRPISLPPEGIRYLRAEQKNKLKRKLLPRFWDADSAS